jgi:hypothetical protein
MWMVFIDSVLDVSEEALADWAAEPLDDGGGDVGVTLGDDTFLLLAGYRVEGVE